MSLMDKFNKALYNKLNKTPEADSEEQHKEILKLAQAKGGTATVSEIALGTSLSLEEAEEILQYFVSKGYANMRLNDNGAIVYEFPGIRPPPRAVKTAAPRGLSSAASHPTSSTQAVTGKARLNPPRPDDDAVFKTSGRKTAQLPDWMKNRKKDV